MLESRASVNYYETHGLHLIRISKTGVEAGKRPQDMGWQQNPVSYAKAHEWFNSGGNLGWATGPKYLVIDVDPRNGGNESFDTLLQDVGLSAGELRAITPHVYTGSGGRHLYFSVDPDAGILQGPLDRSQYPGIDIKTGAGQVVIAGSTHPNGLPYLPDTESNWDGPPAPLPPELCTLIASLRSRSRSASTAVQAPPVESSPDYGCLTVRECESLLTHIDPENHRDYENWVKHIAAIHHATGGKGLQVAIQWSARDPLYAETAPMQVTRRWDAFARPHGHPASIHTILASLPDTALAQDVAQRIKLGLTVTEFRDEASLAEELEERVGNLDSGGLEANQKEVKEILSEALGLGTVAHTALVDRLAEKLEVRKMVLRGITAEAKRERKEEERKEKAKHKAEEKERKKEEKRRAKEAEITYADFIMQVQNRVFEKVRIRGQCITRAPNEQYYLFNETHWKKIGREYVANLAHMAAHELSDSDEQIDFELTGVTDRVEKSIRAQNYVDSSQLYFPDDPPAVVNTLNGTIWIDNETGAHELKPHNPGDYLTTVIPIKYDKGAGCPSFDTMLEQVFSHITLAQRQSVIRHWWEIVGYSIQPRKNIPLILLWIGNGFNGKTTIGEFLQNLLGPGCALPAKLHEFGSARNQHSTASIEGKLLLVDDDLQSDARLSDGILKKFSESKLVEINPKHRAAYTTRSNLTPLILTNGWPIIRDLSQGLQRRFDVIPFETDLSSYRDSPLPRIAREQEMPGILNRALAGLERLRQRKRFDPPQILLDAKARFFVESNNVSAFLHTNTRPGGECGLHGLYAAYVQYCVINGERNQTERYGRFRAMLMQLGYEVDSCKVKGISADPFDGE